ncbi:Methyl-accepting chemotaxis protein [Candidatus Terasakiella magnetica]|nr:Methyl-accepting chemotaxis protein [Candidatus Terasakiella magnetica]
MKTILRQILAVAVMILASSNTWAADKPSLDQVKALTLRAADLLIRDGVDKTRETFHTDGEFKTGEIYVNVINTNGTWLIYPPNRKNEGKSVLNVKDANGKLLVQDIIRVAEEKGEGWVEYHWLNPTSNKIEPKASYVKNVPERGVITYIGVYK